MQYSNICTKCTYIWDNIRCKNRTTCISTNKCSLSIRTQLKWMKAKSNGRCGSSPPSTSVTFYWHSLVQPISTFTTPCTDRFSEETGGTNKAKVIRWGPSFWRESPRETLLSYTLKKLCPTLKEETTTMNSILESKKHVSCIGSLITFTIKCMDRFSEETYCTN